MEVPATLTVDGRVYKDIGMHFRGASSFMMVGEATSTHSIYLSITNTTDQSLGGYHTLLLLNSHDDPTFLHSVLSYEIAREYIPPRRRTWLSGDQRENWGIYANAQASNKDSVKEWFGKARAHNGRSPGVPMGRAIKTIWVTIRTRRSEVTKLKARKILNPGWT